MQRSETIDELAAAMALAQGAIEGAKKDSENPHFRSRYADLASTWDACRDALTTNGIAVLQFPRLVSVGADAWVIELDTLVTHRSGQWIVDTLAVPLAQVSAQGVGSAITYARRYALSAAVGVAPEDDDGEGAVGRSGMGDRPDRPAASGPRHLRDAAALEPGPETITGKILDIASRPAGTGTRWIVTLDNKKTFGTLRREMFDVATECRAANGDVEIKYRATKLGNEIVTMRDLSLPDPEF